MTDKTFSLEWIQNEINYYSEMCVSASYFDYLDVLKQLRTVTARIAELEAKIARLVEVGDKLVQGYSYDYENEENIIQCVHCLAYINGKGAKSSDIEHFPDCPVTLWNKEAHE